MGDASVVSGDTFLERDDTDNTETLWADGLREVNVLVTGFGPFKSFTTNPSYLVASNLSRRLNPESLSASAALGHLDTGDQRRPPICNPDPRPYQINVHVHPPPIRVAYDVVRETIPPLISDLEDPASASDIEHSLITCATPERDYNYDYVLHIGLAAGRDNYTLETVAHRDHYKLKDVDDKDGFQSEKLWQQMNMPEVLDVGWDKEEVLGRWEALTRQREDEYEHAEMTKAGWKEGAGLTLVETARLRSRVFLGKGKRATVKLSRDAGRYLCEFIFYTSLATRWREFRRKDNGDGKDEDDLNAIPDAGEGKERTRAKCKIGKVAFLHVPGEATPHDVARGVRVVESAILAVVGSWEDGHRNPDVYANGEPADPKKKSTDMYEMKGTGDR